MSPRPEPEKNEPGSTIPGVVFDCNLFLQAVASSAGPGFACLELVENGRVTLYLSDDILDEVRRVLSRPALQRKFPALTPERAAAFLSRLTEKAVIIANVPPTFQYERDPKDQPYVNLAAAAGASYLVTRDRDLLDLGSAESDSGEGVQHPVPIPYNPEPGSVPGEDARGHGRLKEPWQVFLRVGGRPTPMARIGECLLQAFKKNAPKRKRCERAPLRRSTTSCYFFGDLWLRDSTLFPSHSGSGSGPFSGIIYPDSLFMCGFRIGPPAVAANFIVKDALRGVGRLEARDGSFIPDLSLYHQADPERKIYAEVDCRGGRVQFCQSPAGDGFLEGHVRVLL